MQTQKREAAVRLHPGHPIHTDKSGGSPAIPSSHSLSISNIQQPLGIVNNYKQLAGRRVETADKLKLATAEILSQWKSGDEFYRKTGWLRGADGT